MLKIGRYSDLINTTITLFIVDIYERAERNILEAEASFSPRSAIK